MEDIHGEGDESNRERVKIERLFQFLIRCKKCPPLSFDSKTRSGHLPLGKGGEGKGVLTLSPSQTRYLSLKAGGEGEEGVNI